MDSIEIHPWTLGGLVGAFIDLALAYFLLCASTFVFFASKFLSVVGLKVPCPCNGFFGYRNGNLCWHKLLIDLPLRKIYGVQISAKSRFPFDLIWSEDESSSNRKKLIRDENSGNGVLEFDGEACSSSFSSPRNQSPVDTESGFDAKGKRLMNLKQRPGIRRRRRATLAYGKFSSVFPNDSLPSVTRVFPSPCDCRGTKDNYAESLGPLNGREDGPRDDVNAQIGNYKGEGNCHSFELSGSFGESNDTDKNSIYFENYINDVEEKRPVVGSESDSIKLLEQALEEEKAACAALYLELEKERAAAATAADEAMAMISRLQKDKASMEIEARQYQRMIEEKFAYDEEERDILKEILVRREKENHFLEKEIETYRRMSFTGDEQSQGDFSDTLDEWGQRPPLSSLYSSADPQLMLLHKTVDTQSSYNNMEDVSSSHDVPIDEEQSHSNGHDLIEKTVHLVAKEKEENYTVICQEMAAETPQSYIGNEKLFYSDGEELQQNGKHEESCR